MTVGVGSAKPSAQPPSNETGDLQVIARASSILRLAAANGSIRPTDVTDAMGLRRSTAHRYVASLARHGFLVRESDDRYTLGPLMMHLGVLALRSSPVSDIASRTMSELARVTQQTVALAVWAGAFPVVLRTEDLAQSLSTVTVRVGGQLGLESSHAKIFLTFMDDAENVRTILAGLPAEERSAIEAEIPMIRENGIAVRTNSRSGIRAVAAPVFQHPRKICASLALVGPESKMPDDISAEPYDQLRRAAHEISNLMGSM